MDMSHLSRLLKYEEYGEDMKMFVYVFQISDGMTHCHLLNEIFWVVFYCLIYLLKKNKIVNIEGILLVAIWLLWIACKALQKNRNFDDLC